MGRSHRMVAGRCCDVRSHKWPVAPSGAGVLVPTLLRLPLVAVLLLLPMRLPPHTRTTADAMIAVSLVALLALQQVAGDCKHCVKLAREQETMLRAHSEACLAEAGAAAATLAPELRSGGGGATARRYVYCVLQRCKMVSKDGKMLKAAALGKLALGRPASKKIAKELGSCVEQTDGERPEDHAWALFHCCRERKGVPADYMSHLIPADA